VYISNQESQTRALMNGFWRFLNKTRYDIVLTNLAISEIGIKSITGSKICFIYNVHEKICSSAKHDKFS